MNFQSTSGSLPVHLGTIGGHMWHHSCSLPKKNEFPKICGRTEKKVTPKDPLRINARDLKILAVQQTSANPYFAPFGGKN